MQTYTTKQASVMLGVGYSTLSHLLSKGAVPVHRGRGGRHYIITNETVKALREYFKKHPLRKRPAPSKKTIAKRLATRVANGHSVAVAVKGAPVRTVDEQIVFHIGEIQKLLKRKLTELADVEALITNIEKVL